MNKLRYGVFAALIGFNCSAAESTQDYKCYIKSSYGNEYIVFFKWKDKDVGRHMAALPATQLTDRMSRKYFVKSVNECITMDKEFFLIAARELDLQTLR
ncbi:TapY2 family type IVa secretion system protein [Shewanella baltica]|uniref:TapY2 family type IVa secretion system protein n=1 Tax=Shewanella baltica TaxID=62322 RepID=UPI003D0337F9